jgi:uncharacterized membrane protein
MARRRSSAWNASKMTVHPRVGALDAARGLAVVAMVAYHFTWDLAAFSLIDPATQRAPWFTWGGTAIACSFLFLSGFALVLFRRSVDDDAQFRAKFIKRFVLIAAAAALVSVGTYLAMGERWVRFGILHCIALGSLLALPFLRKPGWAALIAGAAALALPWVATGAAFSHPALLWLGLTPFPPTAVDHVPLFPYAGVLLLGVAAGHMLRVRKTDEAKDTKSHKKSDAHTLLGRIGRWSLPIYLIHQPLLFGAFYLMLGGLPAPPLASTPRAEIQDADTLGFRRECRTACARQPTATAEICEVYCSCTEAEFRARDLWTMLMTRSPTAAEQIRVSEATNICTAKARNR